MKLVVKTAMNVPKKEYIRTDPAFFMKFFLFMLYPDSKMMGGRRRITKIPEKCAVSELR